MIAIGEANEGQVWEAAMFTAAKKITNLVWIVDNNKKQLDGFRSLLPMIMLPVARLARTAIGQIHLLLQS